MSFEWSTTSDSMIRIGKGCWVRQSEIVAVDKDHDRACTRVTLRSGTEWLTPTPVRDIIQLMGSRPPASTDSDERPQGGVTG